MRHLKDLMENNRTWAANMVDREPDFFERLSAQQSPRFLWIGCSDSRVPANDIVGLLPGELFVHRNVANLVVHTDLNCLSVMQYAVDVLRVEHIIVCGHYGCGGVGAALRGDRVGLVDFWLHHVYDVRDKCSEQLATLENEEQRHDRLCELNVIEQVLHVSETTIVQDAWKREQPLTIHGWIYGLKDGLLSDLGMSVSSGDDVQDAYAKAMRGPEPG